MCSLAARGLWIEMLGYMHEAEPYGHLLVAGMAPTIEELSSLVGSAVPLTRKAFGELESRNVFSRTDKGVIYSRKMVRDKAKAEQDRANGKRGGNPKIIEPDNGGVNPQDKAQRPEARDQKSDKKEGLASLSGSSPPSGAARRFARQANGSQFADPAIRKQRWEQKVSTFLIETKGADEAMRIIDAYGHGEKWAKKAFDAADEQRKTAAGIHRNGAGEG
jgi:hypothetical protein